MSTKLMKLSYRKTKEGTWVVYGPLSQLSVGSTVTVYKASGETKQELIQSVGKSFMVEGTAMAYGYLKPREVNISGSRSSGASKRTGCSCGSRELSSGGLDPKYPACWACQHDD